METVKAIPKELITKFIRQTCNEICTPKNLNLNYNINNNLNKLLIFTNDISESEKTYYEILKKCTEELGLFIENETNSDRKNWNRNITLFESIVETNLITLYW